MKKKCALILMLILAGVALLTACNEPVEVESIAISEEAEFKTDYIVGEELDLTGILLTVTRTDGTAYNVFAEDIKQDLRILNFSTSRPAEKVTVMLEYKKVRTSFDIVVRTDEEGALRYTVTFHSMGGSEVEPQAVPAYSLATEPTAPVMEGYAFKGWYTETTFNNIFNFSTMNITSDITLYARWAELHSVTFYALKEGIDPEDPVAVGNPDNYKLLQTTEVPEGDAFTAVPAVPTIEGFEGSWDRNVFSAVNGDIEVYPEYTPVYYTVSFVARVGDEEVSLGDPLSVRSGTELSEEGEYAEKIAEFAENAAQIEVEGRIFTGNWYPALPLTVTSNITISADFGYKYHLVTLKWNYETDNENYKTVSVQHGLALTEEAAGAPERDGYVFDGWYTTTECSEEWNFTNTVTDDVTLYAGWRELRYVDYYIPSGLDYDEEPELDEENSFVTGGVTYYLYLRREVPDGSGVSPESIPQATGYSGTWHYYVNGADGGPFNGVQELTEDVRVYALYTPNLYAVNFISDSETVASLEVPYNQTIPASGIPGDPSRNGYTFLNWALSGEAVDFDNYRITSDVNFTAQFTPNVYVVEFYCYPGSDVADETSEVTYDRTFSFPSVTYQDHRLSGWFAQKNYSDGSEWQSGTPLNAGNISERTGSEGNFDIPGTTVLRLYAGWVRQYDVTFYDEDDEILRQMTVDAGSALNESDAPEISGREGYNAVWYEFTGTDLGGEYEFGTVLTGDIALKIVYIPIKYTVTFDLQFRYSDDTVKGTYRFEERTMWVSHGAEIGSVMTEADDIPAANNLRDTEKAAYFAGTGYTDIPEGTELNWTHSGGVQTIVSTVIDAADVNFTAYVYVAHFNVEWRSSDDPGAINDQILDTAVTEFGKPIPEYKGSVQPVSTGEKFERFQAYTKDGEQYTSTEVSEDLVMRPVFSPILYNITFRAPGSNDALSQYDVNGDSEELNANGAAQYVYGEKLWLTDGITGRHPVVDYGAVSVVGRDITGWTGNGASGSFDFYYDSDAGKWYLPTEEVLNGSFILVYSGGNYYRTSAAGGVLTTIANWAPDAGDVIDYSPDGERQYFDAAFLFVTEDVTFDLNDKITVYDVTFDYGEQYAGEIDTVTEEVLHGNVVKAPSTPSAENYIFIGWYLDGVQYDFNAQVVSDLYLTARWESHINGSDAVKYELDSEGTSAVVVGYDISKLDDLKDGKLLISNYYTGGGAGVPVTRIGQGAFENLPETVTQVVIPDSIRAFGDAAFRGASIKTIVLPEMLSVIPPNCFSGCADLEKVIFRNGGALVTIGNSAFAGCTSLKLDELCLAGDYEGNDSSIDKTRSFPEGLVTIAQGAFRGDSAVTAVYFPSTILTIGKDAFSGASLKFVVTSSNLITLGENAFYNGALWHKAFKIYVPDASDYATEGWEQYAERIFDKDEVAGDWAYVPIESSNQVEIVQYLGSDSEITVPLTVAGRTVGAIGDYAFGKGVTKVSFGAVMRITEYTFSAASELNTLEISRGAQENYVDNGAAIISSFQSLTSLDTLSLINPDRTVVNILGGRSLPTSVKKVIIENSTEAATLFSAGVPNDFLINASYVEEVVIIGGNVTAIGENAFSGMTQLRKLTFTGAEGMKSIAVSAFEGDTNLTEIYCDGNEGLPASVVEIGASAFESVPWIDSYKDDQGFTIVGSGILYKYSGSDEIVWAPEGVTSVSAGAFKGNSKVKAVVFTGVVEKLNVASEAFSMMSSLEVLFIDGSADIASGAFTDSDKFATLVSDGSLTIASGALNGTLFEYEGSFGFGEAPDLPLHIYTTDDIETDSDYYGYYNYSQGEIGIEENGWIYSYDSSENINIAIKYLGSAESGNYNYDERVTLGGDFTRVAGYAFPRGVKDVEYYTSVAPFDDYSPFKGLTSVETLTLMINLSGVDGVVTVAGSDNILNDLISRSKAADIRLRINAEPSHQNNTTRLSTVFGLGESGVLSSKISSVEVIVVEGKSAVIGNEFFYNQKNIDEIFVSDGSAEPPVPLENAEDLLEGISIGQRAFRGTGWMEKIDSELVTIGGTLIDIKSDSPVIELPETVTSIAGYAFDGSALETLVINGVVEMNAFALYGADKAARVFVAKGEVTVTNGAALSLSGDYTLTVFDSLGESGTWGGGTNVISSRINVSKVCFTTADGADGRKIQYILGSDSAHTLYMYREYEEADGEYLYDYTDITIPSELTYSFGDGTSSDYVITAFGSGMLFGGTESFAIPFSVTGFKADAFRNLSNLKELEIYDAEGNAASRIPAAELSTVISSHGVSRLVYNGSLTLRDLLGTTEELAGFGISEVEISYGTEETVPELFVGWNGVSSIIFPDTIKKVGVDSLENTLWYQNYWHQKYGSSHVILGGVLYYRYKTSTATGGWITIPKEVRVVNTDAFADLGLVVQRIDFENGSVAEEILSGAFRGCSELRSVVLPASLTKIAADAFEGTLITQSDDMLMTDYYDGGKVLIKYYGDSDVVTLDNTVKVIAAGAFEGNTSLSSISFLKGVAIVSIGENAFKGCTSLTDISSLATTRNILFVGRDAFEGTPWLAGRTGDVYIGSDSRRVLYRFGGGEDFTIDSSLIGITDGVIDTMTGVKRLIFSGNARMLNAATIAKLASLPGVSSVRITGEEKLEEVLGGIYPNITAVTLTTGNGIAAEALKGWENVSDVTIAQATAVGRDAFEGTAWLESLAGESTSGLVVYNNSYILDAVDKGVTEIYCTSGIRYIASGAFDGADWIIEIDFSDCENLVSVPENAFAECGKLTSVIFPASMTQIGKSFGEGQEVVVTLNYSQVAEISDFTGISRILVGAELIDAYREKYPEYSSLFAAREA